MSHNTDVVRHGPYDTAVLKVKDNDEKNSTGTVTMVKLDGAWKLKKESWKTRSE